MAARRLRKSASNSVTLLSDDQRYLIELKYSWRGITGNWTSDLDPHFYICDGEDMIGFISKDNHGGSLRWAESNHADVDPDFTRIQYVEEPIYHTYSAKVHLIVNPDGPDQGYAVTTAGTQAEIEYSRELTPSQGLQWRMHESNDNEAGYVFEETDVTIFEISETDQPLTR